MISIKQETPYLIIEAIKRDPEHVHRQYYFRLSSKSMRDTVTLEENELDILIELLQTLKG